METASARVSYQILLLPSLTVAEKCESIREAAAWIDTYNTAMAGTGMRAVIDQAKIVGQASCLPWHKSNVAS